MTDYYGDAEWEPTDADGYPTEEFLEVIKIWGKHESVDTILDAINDSWNPEQLAWIKNGCWHFATGGLSGNQDLMAAAMSNPLIAERLCEHPQTSKFVFRSATIEE